MWVGVSLHHKTNRELNCSSLSTRSARYGGQSSVEKSQRNAVAARWCSSPSTKLPCTENRGYSDHNESTESKHFLRVEQPPSELRSALYDVNETPLSCRSEQCGGIYPLLSLHGHGRGCRI